MTKVSLSFNVNEMRLPKQSHVHLRQLRHRFYFLLVISDFFAVFSAFGIAAILRFGGFPTSFLFNATILLCFLHLGIGLRVLTPEVLVERQLGIKGTLSAFVWAVGMLLVVAYALQTDIAYSRLWGATGIALSVVFLIGARLLIGNFSQRTFGSSSISRLIVTDGFDVNVPEGVTRFDTREVGGDLDLGHPVILDRISSYICEHDEVIVACGEDSRRVWANILRSFNIPSHIIVPELASYGALGVQQFAGWPVVLISTGYMDWRDRIVKRAFDLAVSASCIIALSPLLIAIAVAIKLDSRGPVLFVQKRVGRGNQLFNIFKFRSMRADMTDQAGSLSADQNDRRVTRVGRHIRSTSLDELPQLFNILRGEMSFVGPRPHAIGSLAGDKLFWQVDERYNFRHVCKPGLTGLAQVRGYRGATHSPIDLVNRLHSDLEYTTNWSLWRDVKIIFSTIRVIIHPNAY